MSSAPDRPASDREALAKAVEGTWITQVVNGDTVTVETRLTFARGVATEAVLTSTGIGQPDVRLTMNGRYAITPSGALDLSLTGREGERRVTATIAFTRRWPGESTDDGDKLFMAAYVPRAPTGRAFRYEEAAEQVASDAGSGGGGAGRRGVAVDVEFDAPLEAIVAARKSCVVRISVSAALGADATTEQHTMRCHATAPNAQGLSEIVLDDLRRLEGGLTQELPFVSDLRKTKRNAKGDLAALVEEAVDRSFFVAPNEPSVLLREYVKHGMRTAWWRVR